MPTELLIALVGVFGFVALVTGSAASFVLERSSPERRRLRSIGKGSRLRQGPQKLRLEEAPSARVSKLSSKVLPKSPGELSRLRRRLGTAGYRSFTAAVVYRCFEIGTPIVLALVPLALLGPRQSGLIAAGFAGAVGFFLPGLVLDRKIATRKKVIRNGLPDALDLFIVCIEAGSSLDQAIAKARDELGISHPALAEELDLVTTEIKAGKPRLEALRNFADRTKVDDVRSLVAILVQTERFGTSVARALRTHADVSRTKRRQRAEEKAQKIGVKLVFPLVFCLFPAFYVVTLGPAVIQYVRVFRGEIVGATSQQP